MSRLLWSSTARRCAYFLDTLPVFTRHSYSCSAMMALSTKSQKCVLSEILPPGQLKGAIAGNSVVSFIITICSSRNSLRLHVDGSQTHGTTDRTRQDTMAKAVSVQAFNRPQTLCDAP